MPDFDLDSALTDRSEIPVLSPCCGAPLLFHRVGWPEWHRGEAVCNCANCKDEFLVTYLCNPDEVGMRCPTDGERVKWSGTVTAGGTWPTIALERLYDHRACPACGVTPIAYECSGDPVPM